MFTRMKSLTKFQRKNYCKIILKKNDNLILTPHIAGATVQDRSYMQELMYNSIKNFLLD